MEPKKERETSVEGLKRKLYQRKKFVDKKPRSYLHSRNTEAPDDWERDSSYVPTEFMRKKKKKGSPFAKQIFLGAVIFFIIAAGFAAFNFIRSSTVSSKNILLTIDGNSFADGGEEILLQVEVRNNNAESLEAANLVLEYPTGASDEEQAIRRLSEPLGLVRPGEARLVEFTLSLFGEQGAERDIVAKLNYRVPDSNAIFEKEVEHLVTIRSTPIDVTIDGPREVVGGQEVTFDVTVASQSTQSVDDMLLVMDYPPNFVVTNSDPSPTFGDNIWELGTLVSNERSTITVTGLLRGEEGQAQVVNAFVGTQNERKEREITTLFNSADHIIDIVQPFVTTNIKINGSSQENVSVTGGQTVSGVVEVKNTLPVAVSNVEVSLVFAGPAFNKDQLNASGFFDSTKNQVIWTRDQQNGLGLMEPGSSVNLSFSLTPLLPTQGASVLKNPEIRIEASVKGADSSNFVRSATRTDSITLKIDTVLGFTSETLHYSGPFVNEGPMPPKAEQTTTYTIHWSLTNPANDISRTRIVTTLPINVTWLNQVSPANEGLTYNTATREVVWTANTLRQGTGFTSNPREVFFKVSVQPSITNIGRVLNLTTNIVATGIDAFTSTDLRKQRPPATTKLLNDTSDVGAEGTVVQ